MVLSSLLFVLALVLMSTQGHDGSFTVVNAIGLFLLLMVAILTMRNSHEWED